MDDDIEIVEDNISNSDDDADRRAFLEPIITRVIDALGGQERGVYRLGDEAYGCLKDLKRLWRKDDTDDDRTVARIFWRSRVLANDLVPILLATAGKGLVEDKRAIICADLITAMTWPIDVAAELKELDEDPVTGIDYTELLQSHLHYKASLLKPGVMQALFGIMLPSLAKSPKERKERDGQIVNVVLHLIRNLAFIKDLPPNIHLSSDHLEFSSLQSRLVKALADSQMTELLLTIATNSGKDPLFNSWNTVVLEIFYLLFRGIKAESLPLNQNERPKGNLHNLLARENQLRKEYSRSSASRHSRFGTTVSVKLAPTTSNGETEKLKASQQVLLHRQQGVRGEAGAIMDLKKKERSKRVKTADDIGRDDHLSVESKGIIRNMAMEFIKSAFNPFLASLLKDIKSERPHITEKDHLRLLFITKWFLEFFLSQRGRREDEVDQWSFGQIAEVTERGWIIWVLKRMREATDEKPKLWVELQAGTECLTQLIQLIDVMSASEIRDASLKEAASVLQQQLIYNGEVLDIAFEGLRIYREGTHSLAYLDATVHLAYALMKMLERWGKQSKHSEVYVRKVKKRTRKAADDSEAGLNEEEAVNSSEEEDMVKEVMFTFEVFEMKFAQSDVTETLLTYLARYKEYNSLDKLKRVVSLLHRQAVKAKAEGLFFKVSTLDLFKTILADQNSFPNEQPYKDLLVLIRYILRQFFKSLEKEPILAIEAFFPKNRSHWKKFSSWEPEEKPVKASREEDKVSAEIEIKEGYSKSEQIGIVVGALIGADQVDLVVWTKEILELVGSERQKITEENVDADEDADARSNYTFAEHRIPYTNDKQASAATKNGYLRLLFRLSTFESKEGLDELEWFVPAHVTPPQLADVMDTIRQYLESPFDKPVAELFVKKRRGGRRRQRSQPREGRKEKKIKEQEKYKSAQFIEDSDVEEGLEEFLAKEKALREKTNQLAQDGASTMKATGTKKRRRGGSQRAAEELERGHEAASSSDSEEPQAQERPRPRAVGRKRLKTPQASSPPAIDSGSGAIAALRKTRRLMVSDSEE